MVTSDRVHRRGRRKCKKQDIGRNRITGRAKVEM